MTDFERLHAEFARLRAAEDAIFERPETVERDTLAAAAQDATDTAFDRMMEIPARNGAAVIAKLRALDVQYDMTGSGFGRERWAQLVREIETVCGRAANGELAS